MLGGCCSVFPDGEDVSAECNEYDCILSGTVCVSTIRLLSMSLAVNFGTSGQVALILSETQISAMKTDVSGGFEVRPFFHNQWIGVAASLSGYVVASLLLICSQIGR